MCRGPIWGKLIVNTRGTTRVNLGVRPLYAVLMMRSVRIVERGIVSGVVSALLVLFLFQAEWLPGLVYGVVVALPWCKACRFHPLQTLAIVVLSVVGYFLAVMLILRSNSVIAISAGSLGPLVMLVPILQPVWDPIRRAAVLTVLVGGVVGVAFWTFLFVGRLLNSQDVGVLFAISCVALWQVATAYTLFLPLPSVGTGAARICQDEQVPDY